MKNVFLSIALFATISLINFSQASAACDPCIYGPGGSFDGDLTQWFIKNCGTTGPRRPNTPPPNNNGGCGGNNPPPRNPRIPNNFNNQRATCSWDSLNCPIGFNCQVDDSEGPFICIPK